MDILKVILQIKIYLNIRIELGVFEIRKLYTISIKIYKYYEI